MFKNNQIEERDYKRRIHYQKSHRNILLSSNVNQSDEKKWDQLLNSIMGILALGSTGFLLFRERYTNPFFSVTKKLVASDPVSLCMPAENPKLEVTQLSMLGLNALRRSYSTGSLSVFRDSPAPVVRASPNPIQTSDAEFFTSSDDSPVPSVEDSVTESSSTANISDSPETSLVDRLSIVSDHILSQIEFTSGMAIPESNVVGASKPVSQLNFTFEKSNDSESLEGLSQGKATSPKNSSKENLRNIRTTSTENLTENWLERSPNNSGTQKDIPKISETGPAEFKGYSLSTEANLQDYRPEDYPKNLKFDSRSTVFGVQNTLPRTPNYEAALNGEVPFQNVENVAESSQQAVESSQQVVESSQQAKKVEKVIQQGQALGKESTGIRKKHGKFSAKLQLIQDKGVLHINQGDDGLLNDANTVALRYKDANSNRTDMQKAYYPDKWVSTSKKEALQYDHSSGKVEHDNRRSFGTAGASYQNVPVSAIPPGLHVTLGNARVGLQAEHKVSALSGSTSSRDMSMANNVTLLKLLDEREERDNYIISRAPMAEFDKLGITKEATLKSREVVYALDRQEIMLLVKKLGLANHVEVADLSIINNVNTSSINCVDELYVICQDATSEQIQNPKFVKILANVFEHLWQSKEFNEGVRSNYNAGSQVCNLMRSAEVLFMRQFQPLLELLADKGLDIRLLHTYNESLNIGGYDPYTFIHGRIVNQIMSREKLDIIATELKATTTCTGRFRILPNTNVLLKALTLPSNVVSSPETSEEQQSKVLTTVPHSD